MVVKVQEQTLFVAPLISKTASISISVPSFVVGSQLMTMCRRAEQELVVSTFLTIFLVFLLQSDAHGLELGNVFRAECHG